MSATPDSSFGSSRTVADLRRELAECKAERDAALAREAATAEVLQVINSSPGDLAPVFDAILEKALRLCSAAHGHVFRIEGDLGRAVAARGDPEFVTWLLQQGPVRPTPAGILYRMMGGERVVQIPDSTDTEAYRSGTTIRDVIDRSGVRTTLAVALRNDEALLGAIFVNRREVRPFTDKQIALLQNFAAQAVIAIENARLLTETREALEQQTATAEVLQVISSSPGDLAPVFEAMLEKAIRLCEADFGLMLTVDVTTSRVVAERGVPEPLTAFLAQHPPDIRPDTFFGRAVLGRSILHTADMREEAAYRSGQSLTLTAVDHAGVRALLMAPLLKDGGVSGVFAIFRREVRPFTDKQIALLQNFAAQAVIAMENARLLIETREALEQQTATAEVLQVINSSPGELAPVFDAMLEKAMRLCEAPYGALRRFDGEFFRAIAVRDASGAAADTLGYPIAPDPGSASMRLVLGESVVHIPDVVDTEEYRSGVASRLKLVELTSARTALWVSLRKNNVLLGDLVFYRREVQPFSDKQIALLQNFAEQAVIAMENARLLTETREALEQQTATAEVLQVINSSPGDLGPVFDALLDKALRLCEASLGHVVTYDGERFCAGATRGHPQFDEWLRGVGAFLPEPGSTNERIVHGESIIEIRDLADDPASKPENPIRRALIEIGGFRTSHSIALRKERSLLGVLHIHRREVRPFSEKEIALLQNFAAQAVIAMENARLLTETREALEQQTATAEVLQVINSSPGNLAPVFDAMLDKVMHLCEAAHGGFAVYEENNRYRVVAYKAAPPELVRFLQGSMPVNPRSPPQRVRDGEPVVHVADLAASDYHPKTDAAQAMVELGGARSSIWVGLRKDEVPLGFFSMYRAEVRPFTDKQIALLQNFAGQAVIAMENARLLTETREALEQQTATAEVLQVINSSPGNLAPVFNAMLEKAVRLCEASHGNLYIYDGEFFRTVAVHGDERLMEWLNQIGPFRPIPGHPIAHLLDGRPFLHIADATKEETYRSHPIFREFIDKGGIRSSLIVAMRKDGAALGVITAYRQEVRPFSEKQIALLQNFAAQAVIAMENARLLTETREAMEQQTATAEVLQVINSSPGDLTPVFDAVVEKAMRLCEATNGYLFTYDGDRFHAAAIHGDPRLVEWHRQLGPFRPAANTGLDRIRGGERLVHTPDMREVDVFRTVPGPPRQIAEISGVRSALAVALRRDEVLLGALGVYRQEVRPFTDKQIALLQNFAAQAVIAMENARLIGELRERTDQVAELNRGLEARVAEQVEELGRVGRLKRFLAPQLAELIVSQGDEQILESHRREIVVVFCDLRGYTAFTETAEPEEVLDFLREYHGALGPLVAQFEGTLDQFSGDGIMVFFNDPVPCPDPAERAVKMAMAMREEAGALITSWRRRGRELGFGCGIAQGYATLGQIGFADRSGYTAIGTVCNLAARLCAEAKDGQILVAQRVALAVEETMVVEEIGALALKGLTQPVVAFNVPVPGAEVNAHPRSK